MKLFGNGRIDIINREEKPWWYKWYSGQRKKKTNPKGLRLKVVGELRHSKKPLEKKKKKPTV
jgi:hypothetical protein